MTSPTGCRPTRTGSIRDGGATCCGRSPSPDSSAGSSIPASCRPSRHASAIGVWETGRPRRRAGLARPPSRVTRARRTDPAGDEPDPSGPLEPAAATLHSDDRLTADCPAPVGLHPAGDFSIRGFTDMQERKRLSDILPQAERDRIARLWETTKPAGDLGLLPAGEYRLPHHRRHAVQGQDWHARLQDHI